MKYLSFIPLITGKIASVTVSLSAVYIACQEMACGKMLERGRLQNLDRIGSD